MGLRTVILLGEGEQRERESIRIIILIVLGSGNLEAPSSLSLFFNHKGKKRQPISLGKVHIFFVVRVRWKVHKPRSPSSLSLRHTLFFKSKESFCCCWRISAFIWGSHCVGRYLACVNSNKDTHARAHTMRAESQVSKWDKSKGKGDSKERAAMMTQFHFSSAENHCHFCCCCWGLKEIKTTVFPFDILSQMTYIFGVATAVKKFVSSSALESADYHQKYFFFFSREKKKLARRKTNGATEKMLTPAIQTKKEERKGAWCLCWLSRTPG